MLVKLNDGGGGARGLPCTPGGTPPPSPWVGAAGGGRERRLLFSLIVVSRGYVVAPFFAGPPAHYSLSLSLSLSIALQRPRPSTSVEPSSSSCPSHFSFSPGSFICSFSLIKRRHSYSGLEFVTVNDVTMTNVCHVSSDDTR